MPLTHTPEQHSPLAVQLEPAACLHVPLQQVWPVPQVPQLTVWPQLFVADPQVWPPQVVARLSGVQQVRPAVQTWPAVQQLPLPQLQVALAVAPTAQAPTHWPPQQAPPLQLVPLAFAWQVPELQAWHGLQVAAQVFVAALQVWQALVAQHVVVP
jgi:hypothetical protein